MSRLNKLLSTLKDKAIINSVPVAVTAIILAALYALGLVVEPGLVTYVVSLPALAVIATTALARVNDIKKESHEWQWQLRRVGLTLVGTAAVVGVYSPITDPATYPTWKTLVLYYGLALTWLTTPNMPPWWKYISGAAPKKTSGD